MMPIYSFDCEQCLAAREEIVSYARRDDPLVCEACGGVLRRRGVELPTIGAAAYQMQAVMSNGQHVAGHFGKDASRRRR